MPVWTARFINDDTKLPDWLAIEIRPAVPLGKDVVQRGESELGRVGGCASDDHALGLEKRPQVGPPPHATSTSASTATGRPPATTRGLRSMDTIAGSAVAISANPST